MDARLYRKAHSVAAPYTLDKFMRDKINGKLAAEKTKRVQFKTEKLPKTNKDLFLKLKENEESGAKKKQREAAANMLADDRFGAMFTDENFQVDQNDLTFKLLNPVLTKLDNKKVSFDTYLLDFPHNVKIRSIFFCCVLTLQSLCPVGCLSLAETANRAETLQSQDATKKN